MNIHKLIIILFLVSIAEILTAQFEENYFDALDSLTQELKKENPNFKKSVFLVENAFYDNQLNEKTFNEYIESLVSLSNLFSKNNQLKYSGDDKENVEKMASIFKVLTDTIKVEFQEGVEGVHYPYHYDFEDIFGDGDWSKMFVSKLLRTGKGNCHSLPYLYKIIADEVGVQAHLALAPNHIYIKQRSDKTGWYNTELTSASFPIDAWLMASGYIYLEAIQNGIYMKPISEKECIAMCITDLAMGYEKKFPFNDGTFTMKCCNLALEHFPNYINALLLKAETQKKQFQQIMNDLGAEYPSDIFHNKKAKKLFEEMQSLYFSIHKLGYRQMPKEMYLDWLASLNEEKEKYENNELIEISGKD